MGDKNPYGGMRILTALLAGALLFAIANAAFRTTERTANPARPVTASPLVH